MKSDGDGHDGDDDGSDDKYDSDDDDDDADDDVFVATFAIVPHLAHSPVKQVAILGASSELLHTISSLRSAYLQ
eukprot:5638689-Amphidinium_carterae.1